MEINFVGVDFV